MKNAEWIIKNGHKFSELSCISKTGDCDYDVILNEKCIGRVNASYCFTALTEWLDMEHKEPILDDVERKYLSAFIKPFRGRVKHICRIWYLGVSSSEYQRIYITLSDDSYDIDLPLFKKETMYKGMELGKAYTLEELGL